MNMKRILPILLIILVLTLPQALAVEVSASSGVTDTTGSSTPVYCGIAFTMNSSLTNVTYLSGITKYSSSTADEVRLYYQNTTLIGTGAVTSGDNIRWAGGAQPLLTPGQSYLIASGIASGSHTRRYRGPEAIGYPKNLGLYATVNDSGCADKDSMTYPVGWAPTFYFNIPTLLFNDTMTGSAPATPTTGRIGLYDKYDNTTIQGANITIYNTTWQNSTITDSQGIAIFPIHTNLKWNATKTGMISHQGITNISNGTSIAEQAATGVLYTKTYEATDSSKIRGNKTVTTPQTTYTNITNTTPIYVKGGTTINITYAATGWYNETILQTIIAGTNTTYNPTGFTNSYLTLIGNNTGTDLTSGMFCSSNSSPLTATNTYFFTLHENNDEIECSAQIQYPLLTTTINKTNFNTLNLSMHAQQYTLQLNFSENVSGTITWTASSSAIGSGIRNFSYKNNTYSTDNFCDGTNACYVEVEFNDDGTGKQIYEFYNDYTTPHVADLFVTSNQGSYIYFKTVGQSNNPIGEVQLQLYRLDDGNGNQNYSMIGQRYTLADGTQTFYLAGTDYAQLLVIKEGYGPQVIKIAIDEFQNVTYAQPYTIQMTPFATIYGYDSYFGCFGTTFSNESDTELLGFWTYTLLNSIQYNTTYNNQLYEQQPNALNFVNVELTRDTHYTDQTFTVNMYDTDGTFLQNCTYNFWSPERRDMTSGLDGLTGLSTNFKKTVLLILILIIAVFVGALIGTEQGTAGFHTFMVGSFAVSLVMWQFWPLSFTVSTYYVLSWIFKTTEA